MKPNPGVCLGAPGNQILVSVDPAARVACGECRASHPEPLLQDLPAHVCVCAMPPGSLLVPDWPLKDLDDTSLVIKHFLDLILDSPADTIDVPAWKAIFRGRLATGVYEAAGEATP